MMSCQRSAVSHQLQVGFAGFCIAQAVWFFSYGVLLVVLVSLAWFCPNRWQRRQ